MCFEYHAGPIILCENGILVLLLGGLAEQERSGTVVMMSDVTLEEAEQ
jgi:hypothetical protein